MFSTITTAPSTMMPKSIAPIESKLAGMCRQSRQMNENIKANGNRHRHDEGGAHAEQKQSQNHQHQQHSAQQVPLHRLLGLLESAAAVVKGHDLHVRRQHMLIQVLRSSSSTRFSTTWACSPTRIRITPSTASSCCMYPNCPSRTALPDLDLGHVLDVDRNAVFGGQHDVADILRCLRTSPSPRM